MVQKGKATTLYIAPDLMEHYRVLVSEKLGIKQAGKRIVELVQQDMASLEGKPVIDSNEDIRELRVRLRALTKERDETKKLVSCGVFERLMDLALSGEYNIDFEPPDKAKEAIGMLVKDFNAGKIREKLGDFQLFISYAEISVEYYKVLNRIAELRGQKYGDPTLQPLQQEAKQPEATLSESNQAAATEEDEEGNEEGEDEEPEGYDEFVEEEVAETAVEDEE